MIRILIYLVIFTLGGCSAQKPVPEDRYFRLPDVAASSIQHTPLSDGIVYVSIFESNGLHRERALVYSDSREGVELRQYHYHHWVDSPTRMIRDHLVHYLRAIGAAPTIVSSIDPDSKIEIKGKIHRFDRVINNDTIEVVVALELSADRGGRLLHVGDYILTEPAGGRAMNDTVEAFHRALTNCFNQFVSDVAASL